MNKDLEIYKYLKDKGIYAEVSTAENNVILVLIEWGDWKHDHGYCRYLMEQIGYEFKGEEVTEEDGSDCYSALHYYSLKA